MSPNYFVSPETARRYAASRPDLNRCFNSRLVASTGVLESSLDLGCGTGLSSRALAEVARHVIGLDPSLAMLGEAEPHPRVRYCAGVAEAIPLRGSSMPLISVGLALHWFDRAPFLAEVERVLEPGGWLFIYNTWFCGRMRDRPEFERWSQDRYLARYPIPPRHRQPLVGQGDLELRDTWSIEQDVPMTAELLAMYLTTQSNVSAVVERGEQSLASATQWLRSQIDELFRSSVERFPFGGTAWLLQRRMA